MKTQIKKHILNGNNFISDHLQLAKVYIINIQIRLRIDNDPKEISIFSTAPLVVVDVVVVVVVEVAAPPLVVVLDTPPATVVVVVDDEP